VVHEPEATELLSIIGPYFSAKIAEYCSNDMEFEEAEKFIQIGLPQGIFTEQKYVPEIHGEQDYPICPGDPFYVLTPIGLYLLHKFG
jgi:hypothetical protein